MQDPRRLIVDYLRALPGQAATPEPALLDAPLRDVIDSIGMIDFLGFLESTFSIAIQDDEVTPETFETPRSAVAFVEKKLGR